MALQKTQVSLDLISGTETKTNNQINDKNQDMINVVFTGDMTAKKMNGYDLLTTLPGGEYYSALFTRGNELLAQTEKGTYKYQENFSTINKIDEIGSTAVDSHTSFGDLFCAGNTYDMSVALGNTPNGVFANPYFKITFSDKSGNVVNTIKSTCSLGTDIRGTSSEWFKFTQACAQTYTDPSGVKTEIFYFLTYADNGGPVKFVVNSYYLISGVFTRVNQWVSPYYVADTHSVDLYSDTNTIDGDTDWFMAIKYTGSSGVSAQNSIIGFDGVSAHTIAINTGGRTLVGNIQLSRRDSNSFYCSFTTDNATGGYFDLVQGYYIFTAGTPSFSANSILYSVFIQGSDVPCYINYPINDTSSSFCFYIPAILTTANTYAFSSFNYSDMIFTGNVGAIGATGVLANSGSGNLINGDKVKTGLTPVSEIFCENGEYYIHCIQQLGLKLVNFIVKVSTGTPVATFDSTKGVQVGIKDKDGNLLSGISVPDSWSLSVLMASQTVSHFYTLHKPRKYNNEWFFSTREFINVNQTINQTRLFSVNFNASLVNTQIELTQKSHIFNGQPVYYDGLDLSEMGFSNAPTIGNVVVTSGSSALPVNTNYQLVAVYRWTDTSGNVFYSDLSNIAGLNTPIPIASSEFLTVTIYLPLLTTKSNVEIILYIKKGSDQFRMVNSSIFDPTTVTEVITAISMEAKVYYTNGADFLYATSTFTAGGDYPTSVLTDAIASAIHEDRFFAISRDNPFSVAYSQQKLEGFGPEFNQDIFYLNVYDKRGVYEDKLTGLIAMDGRLFIFKERSILYMVGSGPSRANTSDDFSSPQLVTTDVGCTYPKSLVLVPNGIMFMSDKGIYLLDRKLQVSYLGSSVERFNGNTITSAILLEHVNEVRFTSLEGEILVYNYFSNAWSWFTDFPTISACIWKGKYSLLMTDGRILTESKTHKKLLQNGVSTPITQKISSPWVKATKTQGWEKVYQCFILGDFKSDHQLKVSFYYDYENYASDVYTLDPLSSDQYNLMDRPSNSDIESGTKTDGVYQISIDMIRKNCQSFRMEIEDIPLNIDDNTGECFALSNLSVTLGAKQGPTKTPNAKSY